MTTQRLIARLKDSGRIIRFELYSYLCSFVGMIRIKLFFNAHEFNKLEIGSGPIKKKDFVSSDINLRTDYPFDLRLGLPFPPDSIDMIYAEHVFEHFDYTTLANLLRDCFKVLKPGGVLSAAVPDAGIYLKAYADDSNFNHREYSKYDFGLTYRYRIDYVNYIFYMGGHHRYMFDKESLVLILKDAGFKDAKLREFDPDIDQREREYESIYITGSK
jgi:predicted SAM-dependent methyltransferase